MNILTRDFLNEINAFLSTDTWPVRWSDDYGVSRGYMEYNNDLQFDSDSEYIVRALGLLPEFNPEYSENRDTGLNYFLKYHDNACDFESFNINRLDLNYLNDRKEGKWFDEYVGNISDIKLNSSIILNYFIDQYSVLATFTTTTMRNHRYMTSNYSRNSKKAIRYNGEEVITNFDSLFSKKIKPIRGFIRYDKDGKDHMIRFINMSPPGLTGLKNFLLMVAATYIKGKCMSEEAEYRFLAISTNDINSINISCLQKECLTFNCQIHERNKFYIGEDDKCSGSYDNNLRCNSCV